MSSRVTDALLDGTNRAYRGGSTAPILNPKYGGTQGHFADYGAYVNSTPYVNKNLVARLVAVPKLFLEMPNSDYWIGTLKAIIELHPVTWSGFESTLQMEWQEDDFGASGEKIEAIGNVTRGRITPTAGYVDKVGRPLFHFFYAYITTFIMDPETKHANISTYEKFRSRGTGASLDLLPDQIGFTTLFYEPDPGMMRIEKAYLTTAMMPKDGPPETASKDKRAGGQLSEFDMPFTGITQSSVGVYRLAQQFLDNTDLTGANPNFHPAFVDRISADVTAVDRGYAEDINRMAGDALTP